VWFTIIMSQIENFDGFFFFFFFLFSFFFHTGLICGYIKAIDFWVLDKK
jgi:hypothetical protein